MASPRDQRLVIILGGAVAVLAAVIIAVLLMGRRDGTADESPAERGGLQLDVAEAPSLEPDRQLRCFVEGQFVGMATLRECAERNGVAAQALDVGLDASGELAAAPTASFAPPPALPQKVEEPAAPPPAAVAPPVVQPAPQAPARPTAACLRHTGSEWRQLSGATTLNACVQMLFAGQCERPGGAAYGRWGETTLRLVPRRVEQSSDNVRFRTLVEQGPNCAIPEID